MEDRAYRKLFWKIVVSTLGFSLVPLFALGFSMYHQFSVSYTSKIMESLRTLAENRRNTVDLFLDERISQLYTLVQTNSFQELANENYLNNVFTLMQLRAKSYVDLGIINEEGDHIAYVGPYRLKGLNYKNEEWFQEVMLRGIYVSDVYTGFRRFPHFIIALTRREGDKIWILRASIDTGVFEAMVRAAQLGKSGDAFLVNDDYVLQTKPRFGGELLSKVENLNFPKFSGTIVEMVTASKAKALYAATWLNNKDWLLVIKEDPAEELLPLLHARVLVVVLGVAGLALIIVGTVFMARAMTAQLVKTDREKAVLDAGLVQSSKMAALGKLAAGIAHEVNNPLAVIKEKVGWMKDLLTEEDIAGSENFKEFEESVGKIEYHVERARKVTHRLLGFARRMEPIQERVDINQLLDLTLDFLKNEAHYRNIEIRTDYYAAMPQTTSDSAQLQQVFLNILNNAIDAINKDGQVVVKSRYRPEEKQISIEISDNGPGIPNENLNRIFDPFFTTKGVGSGTGLGLSISYSIVEKLGGKIMVGSQVGKGTTFTIQLPVKNDEVL